MSLLPTDRLAVSLMPSQVGVSLMRGGWGRREANQTPLDVSPLESAKPAWQGALDVVGKWLEGQKLRRPKTTLVLSNRFVRFALMPWSDEANRPDEATALALACLEARYGDMAGWTVRLDAQHYGEPRVVCAVETVLLDGVRQLFERQKLVCDAIVPAFVAGWNRCRAKLDGAIVRGDGLFGVVDSDVLVVATRHAGRWHSVRSVALRKGFREVPALLEREGLLQGFAEPLATWLALPVADRHAKAIESGNAALRIVGSGTESHSALALASWESGW